MNTVIRKELIPIDAIQEVVDNSLGDEFYYVSGCLISEDLDKDNIRELWDNDDYRGLRQYIVEDTHGTYPSAQLVALLDLQIFLEDIKKM